MASKAKQELARVRQAQVTNETLNVKDTELIELELKNRIALAKKQYTKRSQFIQCITYHLNYRLQLLLTIAGPQFFRHGYCMFGEVLHVSMLSDESYAVFSNDNTLELWIAPPMENDYSKLHKLITDNDSTSEKIGNYEVRVTDSPEESGSEEDFDTTPNAQASGPKEECDLNQLITLAIPSIVCATEIGRVRLTYDMSSECPAHLHLGRDSICNPLRTSSAKINLKRTVVQLQPLREAAAVYMFNGIKCQAPPTSYW